MDSYTSSTLPMRPSGLLPLSLDRPFGIHLWPYFDKGFRLIFDKPATSFEVVPGTTPMTTLKDTLIAITTYYVIVLGGREIMRGMPAFKLQTAFMIHNLILSVLSGALLALFIEQLLPTLWREGLLVTICQARGGWTKPLVLLYYINYLTKFYELLDTVFLVLRKKPLTFLHTYHHGATVLLCYVELVGTTPVSSIVITLNLTVHVVMYWYYFQSSRGIQVWWKKYITVLQIAQFVIDVGVIYFGSYTYFSSTYFPWAPNMGTCMGAEYAAWFGASVITSYLFLFISFYFRTYKGKGSKSKVRHANGTAKGTVNGTTNGSAKKVF